MLYGRPASTGRLLVLTLFSLRAPAAAHIILGPLPRAAATKVSTLCLSRPFNAAPLGSGLHTTGARRNGATQATIEIDVAEHALDDGAFRSMCRPLKKHGLHGARPRKHRHTTSGDRIGNALHAAGKASIVPRRTAGKTFRGICRASPTRSQLNESDDDVRSSMRIIARYIAHHATDCVNLSGDASTAFELTSAEISFLDRFGDDIDDIRALANIITAEDSNEAAARISQRIVAKGPSRVPFNVLAYVLRRPYLRAHALQSIISSCRRIQDAQDAGLVCFWNQHNSFVLFTHLIKHARVVLPSSIVDITTLLLDSIAQQTPERPTKSIEEIKRLTNWLNEVMRLVARPVRFEPFKNTIYQHEAMVKILTFMAEHEPQLQIGRAGYKAVTLIQLAQPKTASDRQWAKLKALSWPPWKSNRTAMDEHITVESHGTSPAAKTLQDMRSAGYAPAAWDDVARVYSGWDTDRTPVIQRRKFQLQEGRYIAGEAALWVARITATRTAQEAWACYLEYERTCGNVYQEVCLAVFEKLFKEQQRAGRMVPQPGDDDGLSELQPGDTMEIQPLPPSTHLHTHTTSPVPTVAQFYQQLRRRGLVLGGRCLAFLITKAQSRSEGIQYLQNIKERYRHLTIDRLSTPLFTAAVSFLSGFPNIPLQNKDERAVKLVVTSHDQIERSVNTSYSLGYAMMLLELRNTTDAQPWMAMLTSLAGRRAALHVRRALLTSRPEDAAVLTQDLEWCRGTMISFDLAHKITGMMHQRHMDLDTTGLLALCVIVEKATVGSWKVLRLKRSELEDGNADVRVPAFLAQDAAGFLQTRRHNAQLKRELWRSIGVSQVPLRASDDVSSTYSVGDTPRFLSVPGPALIHAYIRALGWNADYDGLVDFVRWMAANSEEVARQRARDRNGAAVMRRATVALRVFLERHSWLSPVSGDFSAVTESDWQDEQLRRLSGSAPDEVVDEIRALVDAQEDWRGWPSDDEVREYCSHFSFRFFFSSSG